VKISTGETFLDHPVRFSQNKFFIEASVIKSGMSWHASDTIFMAFHLVFGPVRNARFEGLDSNYLHISVAECGFFAS
jgi:hypothetical protein